MRTKERMSVRGNNINGWFYKLSLNWFVVISGNMYKNVVYTDFILSAFDQCHL